MNSGYGIKVNLLSATRNYKLTRLFQSTSSAPDSIGGRVMIAIPNTANNAVMIGTIPNLSPSRTWDNRPTKTGVVKEIT